MPKPKAVKIEPAVLKRLLKLAKAKSDPEIIPTVLGSSDPKIVEAYTSHLKETEPGLFKEWREEFPEAFGGESGDGGDDDFDIFGDEPEKPAPKAKPAAVSKEFSQMVNQIQDGTYYNGTRYETKFRLRNPDGTDTDLELFSKNPSFGFILRVPVPVDMRTVLLASGEHEVDYLALLRDPEGRTEIGGKSYRNQRLIQAIEMDEED